MVSADRLIIMETNRSLRNIKTELENLLDKGVIDETVFDNIHAALPDESPLSGPLRTATSNNASPAPARSSPAQTTKADPDAPPTKALQNLSVTSNSPAPPSYDETPPPNVPDRNAKPVIAHARAVYRYVASDARDLSLERDDKIAVHEYMNADWWMGRNLRTGQEGIFPCTYVVEEHDQKATPSVPYAQPQYGYPTQQGPPPQQNPYNANVPPMAVADGGGQPAQGGGDSKAGGLGKKFGKKLGNAAIFGAGATIGGNIVNSIF